MRTLLAALMIFFLAATPAWAQLRVIRDAEIEETLRQYARPLLESAGLEPSSVDIIIVQDDAINAFVSGGQNIFLHTGLLTRTDEPGELIGVMAHEIGHISGAHLAKTQEYIKDLSRVGIITSLLGVAAGVASGSGQGTTAAVMGTQHVLTRSFLSYTRTHEQAADQVAVNVLERNGFSAQGMENILTKIKQREGLYINPNQNPYVRSHPITSDRINFIEGHMARSLYTEKPYPKNWQTQHQRMLGKLRGFLHSPRETLKQLEKEPDSLANRYARTVALYRLPKLTEALTEVDSLLKDYPNDPYFLELKGQMLFENGRVADAATYYRHAVKAAPQQPLLRVGLAQALIEQKSKSANQEAVENLEKVLKQDHLNSFAWRLLAIGYGRLGQEGESAVALAEEANLTGDTKIREKQASKASALLPYGSPKWLRAQDLLLKDQDEDS